MASTTSLENWFDHLPNFANHPVLPPGTLAREDKKNGSVFLWYRYSTAWLMVGEIKP